MDDIQAIGLSADTTQRGPSAFDRALEKIQELIVAGSFRAGDQLPNEIDLAAMLGVSRTPCREAIRVLTKLGVLDVRHGGGTFVASFAAPPLLESTDFLPALMVEQAIMDAFHLRRILEPVAASLATPRLSDSAVTHLRECLERLDVASGAEQNAALEEAFHHTICAACGNATLASLTLSLRRRTLRASLVRLSTPTSDLVAATRDGHRAILHAIEARDSALAADTTAMHVLLGELQFRKSVAPEADQTPTGTVSSSAEVVLPPTS